MHKPPLSRVLSLVTHVMLAAMLAFGLGIVSAHEAYADGETVLVAGSDFQASTNEESAANVTDLLTAIKTYGGYAQVDGMLFGGDYTNAYGVTKEQSEVGMAALREAATGVYPELNSSNMILIQGNHETAAGIEGLAASGNNDRDEYGVFVVNEDDFKWRTYLYDDGFTEEQATAIEQQTATNLMDYLNGKIAAGYRKPIFVLLHVPLHYSPKTMYPGDSRNANYLFNVLNKGAKAGLTIICMYGHNHGSSAAEDFHGGGSVYLKPGDKINIAQNSTSAWKTETLAFTYMNYGFTGYVHSNSGGDTALTMSVFTIGSDQVKVERYDNVNHYDGNPVGTLHDLKSEGKNCRSEEVFTPDTTVYASPQYIALSTQIDTTKLIDNYLAEEASDEEIAQVVIDQIAALPATESLTLADKPAVEAARAAYDALTDTQKALVTNLETLTAAETRIAELESAGQDISGADVTLSQTSYTYTGTAYEPTVTVTVGSSALVAGTDYTVSYANNTNAGTATITVTGTGYFAGTKTVNFTIAKAQVAEPTAASGLTYTGSVQEGVTAGEGYALSGTCSATSVGSYEATATLSDTANHEWADGTIGPKGITWSIAKAQVAVPVGKTLTYTATEQTGVEAGEGYTLSGDFKATSAGSYEATVTLSDTANHEWADCTSKSKTIDWIINPASASKLTIASVSNKVYTGSAIKPTPAVTFGTIVLTRGTDYTLSYANNVDAGTATITVSGSNFKGTKSVTFEILKAASTIKLSDQVVEFTGKAVVYPATAAKKTGSTGAVTFRYYSDAACKKASTPVKPGVYYVKGTLAADTNHGGAASAAARMTVRFLDVPESHEYFSDVHAAATMGFVGGYNKKVGGKSVLTGNFGPEDSLKRCDVAVMLWNLSSKPAAGSSAKSFRDVKSDAYYYNTVRWASSVGVVDGYSGTKAGLFGPNDPMTHQELCAFAAKYARRVGGIRASGSASDYAGLAVAGSVAGWARSSVGWCFRAGLTDGFSGGVYPTGEATRAETASMVYRLSLLL